ncbi:MAG: hypothetical protein M0P20_09770 [Methanocorpusculum sp.]|jgi:hypothetical protein|nr:hypothetical protein [Methanocorpusculum sp.]
MKPHSRTQLKTRTRVFYSSRVAEVCEIIDEEYTALVINSADFHSHGTSFFKAVDKYHLAPYETRNVVEALGSIWRWQIGKYVITKPVDAEERR